MGGAMRISDLRLPEKINRPARKKQSVSSQEIEERRFNLRNGTNFEKPKSRLLHDSLPSGSWKGRRCFIIGGGTSLKGFDFSKLNGELVIACNRAFESFPSAAVMIAQDARLWGWYESGQLGEEAKRKFQQYRGFKSWVNVQAFPYPEDVFIINTTYAKDFNWKSYDYSQGLPWCSNTGLDALCLAVCLEANPIYLLGFDCYGKDGKTANFHEGYPGYNNEKVYEDSMVPDFNNLSPQLNEAAEIINLNPESKIRCFKFGDAKEALKQVVVYRGYAGIGDNIWQRPFVKDMAGKVDEFYIETYTPQIYWDIPNVKFIKPEKHKFEMHWNIVNSLPTETWSEIPSNAKMLRKPAYWSGFKFGLTIPQQFEDLWDTETYNLEFPVKDEWTEEGRNIVQNLNTKGKKICVIHFPTKRPEWQCPARDPKPEYMQLIIDRYKDEYFFISLADLRNEEFYYTPQNIDKEFHQGELSLEQIIGVVKNADMIVSGNCYLFALGLAIGTKTFYIGGGTQDVKLFMDSRMDLSKMAYVQPEPFCGCFQNDHNCNKDIPEEKIIKNFEELMNRKQVKKKNILFYKVGPRYHHDILSNIELNRKYNSTIINSPIDDLKRYINENKIDSIVTTNYPAEDIKRLGINYLFFEAFIGNDKVFDRQGFHFTPENEIKQYVDKVKMLDIKLPDYTKVEQPEEISQEDFFKKYGLDPEDRYIVLLGQEMGDKSLLFSKNPSIKTYQDYIYRLAMSNPGTKFIFKPHPVYFTIKKHLKSDIDFIYNYRNIIPVYESIHSLFKIFDKFTAFSSTTIFEGLMRDRKFATVGHHFCDDDRIVLELKTDEMFNGLYERLNEFVIDKEVQAKYFNFLLNYYSMNLADERVVRRIESDSEEYYAN